jgi:hypothetical protein
VTAKRAPIKLLWFEALRKCRDIPRESPSRYAVVVVASVLMGYADPDGRNCYPSIGTIVWEAGVSERTVVLVLAWLTETGWLTVARKMQRRPTIFTLTIPVGAEEHLRLPAPEQVPDEAPYLPTSRYQREPVPAVVPAVVPALEQYDSILRNEVEEEESADARSAVAALASAPSDPIDESLVEKICEGANVNLVLGRVGPELAKAKARTGWSDEMLVGYCVDLFKRQRRVGNPSGFLATDLSRITPDLVPSPAMANVGKRKASNEQPVVASMRERFTRLTKVLDELQAQTERDGVPLRERPAALYLRAVHGHPMDDEYLAKVAATWTWTSTDEAVLDDEIVEMEVEQMEWVLQHMGLGNLISPGYA